MTIDQGRTGRLYAKLEAAYGTEETLASANAMRHINFIPQHAPFNRENSPEKNPSPGRFRRFDRKPATSLSQLLANIQPSGTLNTLPEQDPIFEAAFGSKTNRTVATTVASSPTTTGCTVAAAGALAVGDGVFLEVTGQAGPYIRVLLTVAGNVLTWADALPAAQAVGDDVKGCITYTPTTLLAKSLTILHTPEGTKKRELIGCGIDSLALAFDPNAEVQVTASGPAKDLRTGSTTPAAQAIPGAFTTIGTQNPPSGIVDGYPMIAGVAYPSKAMGITMTNSLNPRNSEYGVRLPTELNRNGPRDVAVTLDAWSETEATLLDKTLVGTIVSVLNQTGKTQGNIIAVYMPRVDFGFPEHDDPDGEINWSFSGVALEGTQGGNNELKLIFS